MAGRILPIGLKVRMSSKCVVAGAACKSDPGHADDLILLFSVSEVKIFAFFLPMSASPIVGK